MRLYRVSIAQWRQRSPPSSTQSVRLVMASPHAEQLNREYFLLEDIGSTPYYFFFGFDPKASGFIEFCLDIPAGPRIPLDLTKARGEARPT